MPVGVRRHAEEQESRMATRSYAGTTEAKELPAGLDWVNTSSPLTLKALRGKIVLLDFWTYC
jgi:hypothetical protein